MGHQSPRLTFICFFVYCVLCSFFLSLYFICTPRNDACKGTAQWQSDRLMIKSDTRLSPSRSGGRISAFCADSYFNIRSIPETGCQLISVFLLFTNLGKVEPCFLFCCRSCNSSPALEYEVDAHSVDNQACTPLVRFCCMIF